MEFSPESLIAGKRYFIQNKKDNSLSTYGTFVSYIDTSIPKGRTDMRMFVQDNMYSLFDQSVIDEKINKYNKNNSWLDYIDFLFIDIQNILSDNKRNKNTQAILFKDMDVSFLCETHTNETAKEYLKNGWIVNVDDFMFIEE